MKPTVHPHQRILPADSAGSNDPGKTRVHRSVGEVACPHCGSKVGELCQGSRGYTWGTHVARRRAATQLRRSR